MTWQERYQSKMNRTSWKIAHEGHGTNELDGHSHLSRGYADEKFHPLSHIDRISDKLNGGTCWPIDHKGCEKCLDRMLERESSTKIAHEDAHPHIYDGNDLQSHLTSHHQGDFIGDEYDHEWFHSDPSDYNVTHKIFNFPIEYHDPDHYHTNDYEKPDIPDTLPKSFANFRKKSDPGSLRSEGISGMIDPDEEVVGPQDLDSNATEVDKFPKSIGVFKNSSKIAHKDKHPWPQGIEETINHLFSHHQNFSRQPGISPQRFEAVVREDPDRALNAHSELHKEPDIRERFYGPEQHEHDDDFDIDVPDNIETIAPTYVTSSWRTANGGSEFGNPIDYNENRMQSLEDTSRLQSRFPLDSGKRNYSEQRQDANPLTLRSWFTGDDVNGPWPHTKNLSGPLDFEPTDDQNEDSTGPFTSSFQSRYSHFDDVKHPFPTEENIYDHLVTHHFGQSPIGDTYLQQTIRERAPLFNNELLGEHLTFHYNDVRKENPLVGKSSWTLYHEHDNNPKIDIPNNLSKISSFESRYAHEDKHPWPNTNDELANHFASHHPKMVELNSKHWNIPITKVINAVRRGVDGAFEAHIKTHKNPASNLVTEDDKHEHDDDFNVDVPDNVDTLIPTYVTSSWHQSFVDVFDTHPDEETPDSLTNPSDELKNGRPRANDLPNQSAQLLPGMLIDHDQMGGSGTASGSF